MNVIRFVKDCIYNLHLRYKTLALWSTEDPLRPEESHPKLRKGHLGPGEGSLRSEEGLFIPTAHSFRQTAGLFRPTEGLVSSAKRQRTSLEQQRVVSC